MQDLHQLSKEMKVLHCLRNITLSFQSISMELLSATLHHVYHLDTHQLWNPPFHSCENLSPPPSNVLDDLLDAKSNTCPQDYPAYDNKCKIISSSIQHGFHYPMDLWLSVYFVLKVSYLCLSSSNTSKQYGYSNHQRIM